MADNSVNNSKLEVEDISKWRWKLLPHEKKLLDSNQLRNITHVGSRYITKMMQKINLVSFSIVFIFLIFILFYYFQTNKHLHIFLFF